jgi:hypothetical protein
MNQELIDMVKQVTSYRIEHDSQTMPLHVKEFNLKAFAALVAAAEREKVEDLLKEYDMVNSAFAQDFRARGETK